MHQYHRTCIYVDSCIKIYNKSGPAVYLGTKFKFSRYLSDSHTVGTDGCSFEVTYRCDSCNTKFSTYKSLGKAAPERALRQPFESGTTGNSYSTGPAGYGRTGTYVHVPPLPSSKLKS